MSTPRDLYNQILKDEIDAFAARMKQVIDDNEIRLQSLERIARSLASAIDRRDKEEATKLAGRGSIHQ